MPRGKSPLSSEPSSPRNVEENNEYMVNPLYNPTPFKNPLSREPTTPTVTSNAFINDTEEKILKENPLFKHRLPEQAESLKSPTTPTVTSNALYNPNKAQILNKNQLFEHPKVSLYKELPKDFKEAMEKYGTPVTIGKGGARRRTKYKRAKKRSLKSRKKSKV